MGRDTSHEHGIGAKEEDNGDTNDSTVEESPLYAHDDEDIEKSPLVGHKSDTPEQDGKRLSDEADDEFNFDSPLHKFSAPIVVGYFTLGSLLFGLIESLSFTDAVYLTTVTLTTVGYGDIAPETVGGKIFFILFIIVGLSLISFALGVTFQRMAEAAADEKEPSWVIFRWSEGVFGTMGFMLLCDLLGLVILTLIGTFWHIYVEDMSGIDSLYWTVATYTTVGYGDLSHSGDPGTKWFLVFYIVIGVTMAATTFANFAQMLIQANADRKVKKLVDVGVTERMIEAMDADQNGIVDRAEFLEFMLVKMKKVDAKFIRELNTMFNSVDLTKSGTLTRADVAAAQERNRTQNEPE